ncbi:MAG: porin family protein [Bacteroidota bacterium]
MKTLRFIFLSSIFICYLSIPFSFGQNYSLGIKAGPSFSYITNFSPEAYSQKKPLIGVTGGLINNFKLSRIFSLQLEILYVKRGFKEVANGPYSSNATYTHSVNYINLPLLFNFTFPSGAFSFSGKAGGYCAVALSGKLVAEQSTVWNGTQDIEFGNIRKFDAGLCAGVSAGYKLGPGDLFVEARFDYGLTKYKDARYFPNNLDHAYYSLTTGIGYMLHFSRSK